MRDEILGGGVGIGDGRWEMGDGRWEMGDDILLVWEMGNEGWEAGDGR